MRLERWEHWNVLTYQKLLQKFTSSDQEVAVAPLTHELERALSVARRRSLRWRLDDGYNCHLIIAFDAIRERHELGRGTDARQICIGRNCKLSFKRNVLLR